MEELNLEEFPHRRYNILNGEWILVSPHRNKRPWQGKNDEPLEHIITHYDPNCYLCPRNHRANGEQNSNYSGPYSFVNDFSALLPETSQLSESTGLLKAKTEAGICKVVCFSADHAASMATLSIPQITDVVLLWQKEYSNMGRLKNINYIQIFENKGAVMGCSNPHPHGQIWAQESLPTEVLKKQQKQEEYWSIHHKSLLLTYISQETEQNKRIIAQNEAFIAMVPYWAAWPFEVMILPLNHYQHIGQLSLNENKLFAAIIKIVTVKYDNLFKTSFPYSCGIHQAPTDGLPHSEWHFHMSFYPPLLRSASIKKFMVGYEMFAESQRDITPERAAQLLREQSEIHYSLSNQ